MSIAHDPHRTEDAPDFWTLAGLASWFGISEKTIERYIWDYKIVPPALGKHPNGFNYDHTHYRALAKHCAEMAARIPLRERRHRPHVVVVARREQVA